ncbi:unnamed protein product, partial [Didymodactylos carnosus]
RKSLRSSPCSLYFLASAINNFFVLYFSLITRLLSDGFSIDPTSNSMAFCKIRYYFSYIFFALSPYFTVLASIDRYCVSSSNPNIRRFSNRTVAYRAISMTILFTLLIYMHMAIYFQVNTIPFIPITYCYTRPGTYATFYALFYLIFYCLLPPVLMGTFGLLTILSIRQHRQRIVPSTVNISRGKKRDKQLSRMLLIQIITEVLLVMPFAIMQLILVILNYVNDIITFVAALTVLPLFFSYCTSFYIYTLSARLYRTELFRVIDLILKRLFGSNLLRNYFRQDLVSTTRNDGQSLYTVQRQMTIGQNNE